MENSSKALRAKPELITVGDRQVSSTGRWNDNLMMDYIEANGKERWIGLGELAKVAWGMNSITTKARARQYLSRVWKALLIERGLILVVEYEGPHNRARAVKIYNHDSEQDRQVLAQKLAAIKHRGEMSLQHYNEAIALLGVEEQTAS